MRGDENPCRSGDSGARHYSLPSRYQSGGTHFNRDLLDYYHVGVVAAVQPLKIIHAKRRFIDPMVSGKGRFSTLSPSFKKSQDSFINTKFDYWICGNS